ncbi:MAG: hypothetical protein R2856_20875 [Caldilineaceae bacterium]
MTFHASLAHVKVYYIYLQDCDFGPGFIKIATYAPYPVKARPNGHEWVKQQLRQEGIEFTALDNGFRSCQDLQRLHTLCDELSAETDTALRQVGCAPALAFDNPRP